MRAKHVSIALAFIVCSCGQKNKESNAVTTSSSSEQNSPNGFWEKLELVELKDANGNVAAVIPIPGSWKIMPANNGGPTITGPNGIQVTDFPLQMFMYNYNPSLQQSYNMAGQQMRELTSVDQLIQEDLVPWGQGRGLEYVKHYEIPEISKMDKWYSDQLFKALPSRSDVVAVGIDWKTAAGNPYFLLLHLNVSTSDQMQQWYYRASGLEANAEHFEAAKKQFIFSLSNMRYNLEPIIVFNQQEAQRVGKSWAEFNQRMAQNQANFEASQRAHVNKSNAINDAIMNGWRERNASSDKQQEQFIDGIYERTNVVDPTTGKGYKVSAGANQYWMNSNGEYIGTQLQDYNPNLDKNMNEQRWQELKLRKQ